MLVDEIRSYPHTDGLTQDQAKAYEIIKVKKFLIARIIHSDR